MTASAASGHVGVSHHRLDDEHEHDTTEVAGHEQEAGSGILRALVPACTADQSSTTGRHAMIRNPVANSQTPSHTTSWRRSVAANATALNASATHEHRAALIARGDQRWQHGCADDATCGEHGDEVARGATFAEVREHRLQPGRDRVVHAHADEDEPGEQPHEPIADQPAQAHRGRRVVGIRGRNARAAAA